MRVPKLVREDEGAVTDLVNIGINLNDKIDRASVSKAGRREGFHPEGENSTGTIETVL